jgi:hypothetical protein
VLQRRSILRRGVKVTIKTKAIAGPAGRRRSPQGGARGKALVQVRVRLQLLQRIAPTPIVIRSRGIVNSFLNAMPIPQPQARLLLQSLGEFENPAQDSSPFGGKFLRGETIPLKFTMRGVRIADLQPIFTACKVGDPLPTHEITKALPVIRLTANSVDTRTGVEERSASFTIDRVDTINLPDGEHEYEWLLIVIDGNGRQHMLDSGKFKIYSYC